MRAIPGTGGGAAGPRRPGPRANLRLVVFEPANDRRLRTRDDWFVIAMIAGLFLFAAAFVQSL